MSYLYTMQALEDTPAFVEAAEINEMASEEKSVLAEEMQALEMASDLSLDVAVQHEGVQADIEATLEHGGMTKQEVQLIGKRLETLAKLTRTQSQLGDHFTMQNLESGRYTRREYTMMALDDVKNKVKDWWRKFSEFISKWYEKFWVFWDNNVGAAGREFKKAAAMMERVENISKNSDGNVKLGATRTTALVYGDQKVEDSISGLKTNLETMAKSIPQIDTSAKGIQDSIRAAFNEVDKSIEGITTIESEKEDNDQQPQGASQGRGTHITMQSGGETDEQKNAREMAEAAKKRLEDEKNASVESQNKASSQLNALKVIVDKLVSDQILAVKSEDDSKDGTEVYPTKFQTFANKSYKITVSTDKDSGAYKSVSQTSDMTTKDLKIDEDHEVAGADSSGIYEISAAVKVLCEAVINGRATTRLYKQVAADIIKRGKATSEKIDRKDREATGKSDKNAQNTIKQLKATCTAIIKMHSSLIKLLGEVTGNGVMAASAANSYCSASYDNLEKDS